MPKLLPIQLAKVLYKLTKDCQHEKEIDLAVEKFFSFVQQERMTKHIPYIIKEFEVYTKEVEGTQDIEITSAKKLGKETIEKIVRTFSQNKPVMVQTNTNSELIGGIIVKQGNTIFDASIKAQLENMKLTLT